jgi:hypothetical protein
MRQLCARTPRRAPLRSRPAPPRFRPSLDVLEDRLVPAPFTPGDLLLLRDGDGSAALSSAATAVFLEERNPLDGTLVQSPIPLPTTVNGSNARLTLSGIATTEGALALSANGQYITLAGYDAVLGTYGVASTTSSAVNRIVARIDMSGNVDTSTRINNLISGNDVRSAVTDDGAEFWVGGAPNGVVYVNEGTTGGTSILASPASTRNVEIFGGQLYGSSGQNGFMNVFTVGTGLPTTSTTETALPGMATTVASPYAYWFANPSTLYVADDRPPSIGGGIQKWTLNNGTWTLLTTFNNGLPTGVRGLSGEATGNTVTLFATTAISSSNQ